MGVLACRDGEGLRAAEAGFLVFVEVNAGGEGLVGQAFPVGVGGLRIDAHGKLGRGPL